MEETRRSSPLTVLIIVALLIGGGVYFVKHFKVAGLDKLSIHPKTEERPEKADPKVGDLKFVSSRPAFGGDGPGAGASYATPTGFAAKSALNPSPVSHLRIGSWAMSGFGPSKLANDASRANLARILRSFDVIALQQITASERDLVPRLVDELNEGGRSFDYVLGEPTGTSDAPEQLAILFNIKRVHVDRSQTYSVADPHNQITYDPLVAWFRAAEPSTERAWTFTVVNVRINLVRAAAEVALLPNLFTSVRTDGRGEDDVIMTGLFQADDSYLIPSVMGEGIVAAVRSTPTDIFNRHQTSNILVDQSHTNEYVGRGGPVDFLRAYNLNLSEAEAVSSHLPVFAEFTATEGGMM